MLIIRNRSKEDYWTAGHDFINEGEWQWYGTNLTHTSANYSNWDVENGQPDKRSIWNQDCLFIGQKERFQFRWHDNSCTYPWVESFFVNQIMPRHVPRHVTLKELTPLLDRNVAKRTLIAPKLANRVLQGHQPQMLDSIKLFLP